MKAEELRDYVLNNCPTLKRMQAQPSLEQYATLLEDSDGSYLVKLLDTMENKIRVNQYKNLFITIKNWVDKDKQWGSHVPARMPGDAQQMKPVAAEFTKRFPDGSKIQSLKTGIIYEVAGGCIISEDNNSAAPIHNLNPLNYQLYKGA